MLEDALTISIIVSVAISIIAFIVRSIIKQLLDKDLENYKTKINAQAEKIRFEHQVRFSKLHERRAEVIAELYGKLVEANHAAGSLASPAEYKGEPSKKEKAQTAYQAIQSFYKYFSERRIYLSKDLCAKIESLYLEFMKLTNQLAFFFQDREFSNKMEIEKLNVWRESWNKISEGDIKEALEALADEFRKILGVE